MAVVIAETSRLRVEPRVPAHAAELFPHLLAPELYTYIDEDPPASVEALQRRYMRLATGGARRRGLAKLGGVVRDTGEPAGTLQATISADRRALVAYSVLPRLWRRGIGREAVAWLLGEIARAGVVRAEALIDTRNAASIALIERVGFQRVETIPFAATVHGERSDEHRYARALDAFKR